MKPNAVPRFMLVHVAAKLFSILGGVGVGWGVSHGKESGKGPLWIT